MCDGGGRCASALSASSVRDKGEQPCTPVGGANSLELPPLPFSPLGTLHPRSPLSPATPSPSAPARNCPPSAATPPPTDTTAKPSVAPSSPATKSTAYPVPIPPPNTLSDAMSNAESFVKLLLRRLDCDVALSPATVRAAWLLMLLSRSPSNTTPLLRCGTVPAMAGILRRLPPPWDCEARCQGDESEEAVGGVTDAEAVVECALGVVANLAAQDYSCRAALAGDGGVVSLLVAVLPEGPDCVAVEYAVSVLHSLAATTPAIRDEIREAGAIPELVTVLYEAPFALNLVLTRSVLWTLICLADQNPDNQRAIWNAGACQALAPLLTGECFINSAIRDVSAVQGLAARCMYMLATGSPDSEFGVCRLGIVPHLVHLLEDNVPLLGGSMETATCHWRARLAVVLAQWALLQQAHCAVATSLERKHRPAHDSEGATELEMERNAVQAKVSTVWREIALELLIRLLPAGCRRLHPAREALRALRAVVDASPSGSTSAAGAGAVPVLLSALRLQAEEGKALGSVAVEPAELLALMTTGNTAVQNEVREHGGVELVVRLLPYKEGNKAEDERAIRQDDIIRFCWDRIMWGEEEERAGESTQHADLPLHACKVIASALTALTDGNAENAVAAQQAGAVRPLLHMLHATLSGRRYAVALSAVSALACLLNGNAMVQRECLCEHGVAVLVQLLRLPRHDPLLNLRDWLCLQAKAAECVQHLVEDFESAQHRVRQAGVLPCLLALIEELLPAAASMNADDDENDGNTAAVMTRSGREVATIQNDALTSALWAVNNMVAHNSKNQDALRRALGLPLLVTALQTVSAASARCAVVWVIARLAAGGPTLQDELGRLGAVAELMALGQLAAVGATEVEDDPLLEGLARATGALADHNPALQDLLRNEGAVELMLKLSQQCGVDSVAAECAAQAVAALCWEHPANQMLVGDCGGLALLVGRLGEGPHSLLARGASLALASAMGNNFRNQTVVREAGGAKIFVDMLRSGPRNPVVVPTLHALGLLVSGYRAAQTEVGEAGGCTAILRLLHSCGAPNGEKDHLSDQHGEAEVTAGAARALAHLTFDHPRNKAAVLRDSGISALLAVIQTVCQALSSKEAALPGAWDDELGSGAWAAAVGSLGTLPLRLTAAASAARALSALAIGSGAVQARAREVGCIRHMIALLGLAIKAREHWPEGRTWLNGAAMEAADALATLSAGNAESQAEVLNEGGLEALVWGLKMGDDEGKAVEEAAYALRCLVFSTREGFWGAARAPALPSGGGDERLAECVHAYYDASGDETLQRRALQQIISESPDKAARRAYLCALMQLSADSEESKAELAELYAAGIAPLQTRLGEISAAEQQKSSLEHLRRGLTTRISTLMTWRRSQQRSREH